MSNSRRRARKQRGARAAAAPPVPQGRQPRHDPHPGLLLAAAVAAAVLVHVNILGNGFTLDDIGVIVDNPRVHGLTDLRAIWLAPYWPYLGAELGLWRPLTTFAFALQWALGGGSATIFHVVSIALHAGAVAVAFLLLRRIAGAIPAFAGALLFAVHPVHVEAVAGAVGQAELLAALAVLGACLVHASRPPGADVPRAHRRLLLLLFAAGLLAKEHAIVLPALLLLVDFVQGRVARRAHGPGVAPDTSKARRRHPVVELSGYARAMAAPALLLSAVAGVWLIARTLVLGGSVLGEVAGPQLGYLTGEHRVWVALQAFPEYMRLLFAPLRLATDYSPGMFTPATGLTADAAAGLVILLILTVLAGATPARPAAGVPAAWFVVTILPASNLVFATGIFVAERTLYLPSFALAAGIALGTAAMLPRLGALPRRAAVCALLLLALAGGARTWVRNADWRSTETLMAALLRDHPESYRAQLYGATLALQRGAPDDARRHYERALQIYADDSELLNEYGNFLLSRDEVEPAIPLFQRSWQLHPFIGRTAVFLGTAYLEADRYEDALALALDARARGHGIAVHGPLAAAALDGLGRDTEAREAWRDVIEHVDLAPPVLSVLLARTLAVRNADDDAIRAVNRGREANRDPGASELFRRVEAAIHDGCYRAVSDEADPPGCDPVAAWLASFPDVFGRSLSPLDRRRPDRIAPPAQAIPDLR